MKELWRFTPKRTAARFEHESHGARGTTQETILL
jgi:nuclear transport factor 2 (NTF2) superfamily protein